MVLFRWWAGDSPQAALRRIQEAERSLLLGLATGLPCGGEGRETPGPPLPLLAAGSDLIAVDAVIAAVDPDDLAHACFAAAASGKEPPAARIAADRPGGAPHLSLPLSREGGEDGPGSRWDILERAAAVGAIYWGIERAAVSFGSIAVPSRHEAAARIAFTEAVGTRMPRSRRNATGHHAPIEGAGRGALICGAQARNPNPDRFPTYSGQTFFVLIDH